MKTFSIKVALAAFLTLTSATAFAFLQDSILFYLKVNTENMFQGGFDKTGKETEWIASLSRGRQVGAVAKSSFETEDALHDILRKIAICR